MALLLLLAGGGYGWPTSSSASFVEPLFDLRTPTSAPFPTDRYAVPETRNLTKQRVSMPQPACATRPSDCNDVEVLNTLDGFGLQPRITIPFSSPINLNTVNSASIFLMRLGDVTRFEINPRRFIGINQIMWDPATNTLSAEPEELLDQHARYLLVVTTKVRDTLGFSVGGMDFWTFINNPAFYRYGCCDLWSYRMALANAIFESGIPAVSIASASLFTTLSATAELEKMRDQVKAGTPAAATFLLGSNATRTFFPLASVQSMALNRQTGTAPSFQSETAVPSAIGSLAFGRYTSPDYTNNQQYIPAVYTRTGTPLVQRTNDLYFLLTLPSGTRPAGGWPVAIYGHGFGSNRDTAMVFAGVMASHGIATIAISVVGHGGGPLGTLTVKRTDGSAVTLPVGGRGIDQNGDGRIGTVEGINATGTRNLIQARDGMRQTVVDLMQLVRVVETNGVDADGDGRTELDRTRIYYFGISFGSMYGPLLLAVDPAVRAGATLVGGGSLTDIARLGAFRSIPAAALAQRTPSLLNLPGSASAPIFGFNDNIPLRNRPIQVNNVVGATGIQAYFDRWEWAANPGDPLAYARHLRSQPLDGMPAKSMLIVMAKGDKTVPNPTSSALVRAGGLADRTTYFRNDLAAAADPAVPKDPHAFAAQLGIPALQRFALAAQMQMAMFFASDGATIIDPDGSNPIFEVPIVGPLPEELGFIP
jgi:hypothetical protein